MVHVVQMFYLMWPYSLLLIAQCVIIVYSWSSTWAAQSEISKERQNDILWKENVAEGMSIMYRVKGCCNIINNAFCLKESCMPTIKYNSSRSYIHLCESSHSMWVDRNIACKTSFLNDQGSEKVFWNVIGLCVTRSKPTNVSWLRKRSFVQLAFNGEIVNKIKYAIIYLEVWTELTWDHGLSRLRLKVKGLGLSLVLFFHL